ncbi:Uncharacterised protein [Segatella copri]|nr:Uncharacterised protein [Segatella copri]
MASTRFLPCTRSAGRLSAASPAIDSITIASDINNFFLFIVTIIFRFIIYCQSPYYIMKNCQVLVYRKGCWSFKIEWRVITTHQSRNQLIMILYKNHNIKIS